jgi:hypothetical protein
MRPLAEGRLGAGICPRLGQTTARGLGWKSVPGWDSWPGYDRGREAGAVMMNDGTVPGWDRQLITEWR